MAKDDHDFNKLLSEAAVAPDVDTVTVVGILGRTTDPSRFVLTLPNGRSETLNVDAVKGAKKVGSTIGQSLVELRLDAKLVPEHLRTQATAPFAAAFPHQADPAHISALALSGTRTWLTAYEWTADHHPVFKVKADQPL